MDPTTVIILVAALVVGAAGGALLARWRVRRAAERARRMEQQAREGERMAYAGRLASGLMHEIKNPLSTLNLNLQLLAEELDAPGNQTNGRASRKIAVLQEETQRLQETLEKFMLFVGRMELKKSPVDIGRAVGDLLDFYEPQAAQHKITLRSAIDGHLPPVEADADLLKQALLNLILNAQAAMPEGGELIVSVRAEGDGVAIGVTDTGRGIPAADLPQIFEAYFSKRRGGLGLGLPIVKRIVTEHGGTVSVSSEVGRGTQMTIRLPGAKAQQKAPATGGQTPRP